MTREQIALLIHWDWVIWILTVLNPLFMFPQLISIWRTGDTKALSVVTLLILLIIQSGFSIHGFFIRDNPLFITNGLASLTTISVIFSVIYFRLHRS